jgi:hypothetical protein
LDIKTLSLLVIGAAVSWSHDAVNDGGAAGKFLATGVATHPVKHNKDNIITDFIS